MKIAIIGPSGSGKGFIASRLSGISRLRYWGSTSWAILPHAARELGVNEVTAWATRHEHRETWRRIGDELRAHDPAALARITLTEGDISDGIRSRSEFLAARDLNLFRLTIWVQRDVPEDPTLELDASFADIILDNRVEVEPTLDARLRRLANALGVLRAA